MSEKDAEANEPIREGLSSLSLNMEYRTGEHDLIAEFYIPCLGEADRYDRAVGYFRSSVFTSAGQSLVSFARTGGRIRLVCSPDLTEKDTEAIERGYKEREAAVSQALNQEIDELLSRVDTRQDTIALATMIAVGAMDIRIALRTPHTGIFHEKMGIFYNTDGPAVSFKGSSNETWSGWDRRGNFESFEVFCSWVSQSDRMRVERHRAYFDRLWKSEVQGVKTYSFPEVALEKLRSVARPSLSEINLNRRTSSVPGRGSALSFDPYPHQQQAVENWEAKGRRGILKHATGSGKTYTALLALHEHYARNEKGVGLILVPSRLLLRQWTDEVRSALRFEPDTFMLLRAGDGHRRWKQPGILEGFTSAETSTGQRLIIATLDTASDPSFYRRVQAGDHLMVIADEVHRAGSTSRSRVFNIDADARLGLSATPERYGDPEGTQMIMDYFGGIVPPVYTIEDAIHDERLVPYKYYPHPVRLNADESQQWSALTTQIRKAFARQFIQRDGDDQSVEFTERLKHLLIQRARIVKKALAKVSLAVRVLSDEYEEGQHWLVYCEDTAQLREVHRRLQEEGLPASTYHTRMRGAREETLDWFRQFGGVLVSIRCLDEGVDIPQVSHALILASSQNPREFIQRRGRVLRTADTFFEKPFAVVHDALVVPNGIAEEEDQTSITKSEIARAMEFARTALNRTAEMKLEELAIELGIDDLGSRTAEAGFEDEGGLKDEHEDAVADITTEPPKQH